MYQNLAIIAFFVLAYSCIAGGLERTRISGAMLFTAFGLAVGPSGLGVLDWDLNRELIRGWAEMTLAVMLFTDAALADLGVIRKNRGLPLRLLLIGLPLTILLGFGVAVLLVDGPSLLMLALLATMLAPTDAALGNAVVTNKLVPNKVRQSLSIESGLNDGICVPVLLVFLSLALGQAEQHGGALHLAVVLVLEEIGIGMVVGGVLTLLGICLFRTARKRDWITPTWTRVSLAALALACFATAQAVGGSGFIAAFCGGLLFRILAREHREKLLHVTETVGGTFALVTWIMFGASVVGHAVGSFTWPIVLYSLLSLTVIRMVPVFLALTGSGLSTEGKLFMGWFGPRGLASIVFAVIVLNSELPDTGPLIMTVVCTVLLSVIFHGLTANPWAKGFGRRDATTAEES
jgi:NhaP-type Na+/H+ or K+/H+ antiporter